MRHEETALLLIRIKGVRIIPEPGDLNSLVDQIAVNQRSALCIKCIYIYMSYTCISSFGLANRPAADFNAFVTQFSFIVNKFLEAKFGKNGTYKS